MLPAERRAARETLSNASTPCVVTFASYPRARATKRIGTSDFLDISETQKTST